MDLVVYVIDPIERNEMRLASGFRIIPTQYHAVVFFVVDCTDMVALGTDDFHALPNVQHFKHARVFLRRVIYVLRHR